MPFSDSTISDGNISDFDRLQKSPICIQHEQLLLVIVSDKDAVCLGTDLDQSRGGRLVPKARCHDLKLLQPNLDFSVPGLRQRFVRSCLQDIIFDLRPQFLRDARGIGVNMLGSQQFSLG